MSNFPRLQSGTAAILALGLTVGAVAPLMNAAPSFAQSATSFSDVSSSYWARDFISELSRRDIIAGFPDGSFKPDAPVTRAQFAAMLKKANQNAFNKAAVRNGTTFVDVPSTYWASSAIQSAYTTGFLAGYPGNIFRPEQNIPREQALTSLANGLNYTSSTATSTVLNYYNDASNISNFARDPIAGATVNNIVVNYPSLTTLNPGRNATRAEVAAFLYQALVKQGVAQAINSPYIVGQNQTPPVAGPVTIPAGTVLPVTYNQAKVLLLKQETVPLTLSVNRNITSNDGRVLIPVGSQINGELRPSGDGSQFFAKTLTINGQQVPFNATSDVITKTESVSKGINVGNLIKDAALGSAAAAAIAGVTGDRTITVGKVLIGTGAGTLVNLLQTLLGQNKVDLISVTPNTDLNLKLGSDLTVTPQQ